MAKILIIDDSVDFRRMLNRLLTREKYQVVEASNGDEGLAAYHQDQIDLVITDIFMPDKDGLETVMELRNINPDVKIIAVSGGGTKVKLNYLPQIEDFGVQKTFEKPFVNDELLVAVRELLEAE